MCYKTLGWKTLKKKEQLSFYFFPYVKYLFIYIFIYTHVHTYTHTHTNSHRSAHMCMCVCVCSWQLICNANFKKWEKVTKWKHKIFNLMALLKCSFKLHMTFQFCLNFCSLNLTNLTVFENHKWCVDHVILLLWKFEKSSWFIRRNFSSKHFSCSSSMYNIRVYLHEL